MPIFYVSFKKDINHYIFELKQWNKHCPFFLFLFLSLFLLFFLFLSFFIFCVPTVVAMATPATPSNTPLPCSLFTGSLQNIYPIKNQKKKDKWAKWAKTLKNTLTDDQLCSLICFFVSAFLHMYHNIYSFITLKKKTELNELNELESSKTPSQMSSYAHKHVLLYLHAQTNINALFF